MARVDIGKTGSGQIWKRYDRPSRIGHLVVLLLFMLFMLLPVIGMLYFTFRSATGGYTLDHWKALFSSETDSLTSLQGGLVNSLVLVIVTLMIEFIIIIPALVLIHVRFPHVARLMHSLMLLPIAIPAIILVVGYAPIYSFLSLHVDSGTWTLALAYGIIAMPFVYTTIESDLRGINALTLTQAAESLGAGWGRILISVIAPCLRRSIIASTLITTAIVLGEFTIASLLNRQTLQTDLIVISQSDVYFSVIVTLIVLILTFLSLFVVSGAARQENHASRG